MKALVYERSVSRYALANLAARLGRASSAAGPVQLRDIQVPQPPNDQWQRITPILSGICGSDLSAVASRTSGYFEQVVSFPFVLGHEVVGSLTDGSRVVVEPALGCVVRGISPMCPSCQSGHAGTCHNANAGDIAPGIQTGFCSSTGGGWSEGFLVHRSQLHAVPDDMTDAAAVMVEPTACAVHAVRERAEVGGAHVAVIGAGTVGLLVTAALNKFTRPASVTVTAKYPHQRKLAATLGATSVAAPNALLRSVRLASGSMVLPKQALAAERLTGGVDVVFDCVGNSASIAQALSIVRPRGRIVLVGMPATTSFDAAPLWQREVELVGAYCYSRAGQRSDFSAAMDLVQSADLGRLVSGYYPLTSFHDAMEHAAHAGARGAVKIVFDLRRNKAAHNRSTANA